MATKVVFPGTFDPPTKGHKSVIARASKLFDEVVVAVAKNSEKKPLFSFGERKLLVEEISRDCKNVTVDVTENEFIPIYAKRIGAQAIIRSFRNTVDLAYEDIIREAYRDIDKTLETVYIPPPKELAHISSSFVKSLVGPKTWERQVKKYLDTRVFVEFLKKYPDRLNLASWWSSASGRLKFDENVSEGMFAGLIEKYSGNGRFYHATYHPVEMLYEVEARGITPSPGFVFALLYHDAFWGPGDKDAVRQSMQYAADDLSRATKDRLLIRQVVRLIGSTDYAVKKRFADPEARLLHDLDFAQFSAEKERYLEIYNDLRKEYSQYSDEVFWNGRKRFLSTLLPERKRIFLTQEFAGDESRARENIRWLFANPAAFLNP